MQGEHSSQSSFFGLIYEDLIPEDACILPDHLWRKLAAVDLGFVSDLVSDCPSTWLRAVSLSNRYCPDTGRPSCDPLVLFKVVFLLFDKLRVVSNVEPQFLYDLSDRPGEEQVNLHLACKWFVALPPEEAGPDHSALCRFRARRIPRRALGARAPSRAATATLRRGSGR